MPRQKVISNPSKVKPITVLSRCSDGAINCRDRIFQISMKLEATAKLLKMSYKSNPDTVLLGLGHLLIGIEQELSDIHTDLDGIQYSIGNIVQKRSIR